MREIVSQARIPNNNFVGRKDAITIRDGVVYVHDGETPGGIPLQTGNGNGGGNENDGVPVISTVFRDALDEVFGLDNITAYWMFDEADTSDDGSLPVTITDHSPNDLNWDLSSGTSTRLGGRSAIADGRTGLSIRSTEQLPWHPWMWPGSFKGYYGILWGMNFTTRWDYVEMRIRSGGDIVLNLTIYGGSEASVTVYNSNGGEYVRLRTPNDSITAGKMLFGFFIDSNWVTLRINKNVVRLPLPSSAVGSLMQPSDPENCVVEFEGGVDSPVVSHLAFTRDWIEDSTWAVLMNAAGMDSVGTFEPPVPMAIARSSFEENFYARVHGVQMRHYWRMDDMVGTTANDRFGGNALRLTEGNIDRTVRPVIDSGSHGARLHGAMESLYMAPDIWQTVDFCFGLAVDTSQWYMPQTASFDIRGREVGNEDPIIRARIEIESSEIIGVFFNEDGDEYLRVSFGDDFMRGPGRFFVALQYSGSTDTLELWVNGYRKAVQNGTGAARNTLSQIDWDSSSFRLAAQGVVQDAFYISSFLGEHQMHSLFTAVGFDQGLFRPRGYTGSISLSPGVSVDVVDGVIVSYND